MRKEGVKKEGEGRRRKKETEEERRRRKPTPRIEQSFVHSFIRSFTLEPSLVVVPAEY